MAWSDWIECKFDSNGEIDIKPLDKAPNSYGGVYAIATKTGSSYNTHYVGRSKKSIWKRLKAHFSGKGNKVIAGILKNKKERPTDPTQALYFAFWKIHKKEEQQIIEAIYISATDRPIANLIKGAKLPKGLREEDVFSSELED